MNLSEKLVELRIATRGATMCESLNGRPKNTLSLKTKVLFLIKDKGKLPMEIMNALHLAKTNLALLASDMAKEGLLTKDRQSYDRRVVYYCITDLGRQYLDARLSAIESALVKTFQGEEYDKALESLDNAVKTLSNLQK